MSKNQTSGNGEVGNSTVSLNTATTDTFNSLQTAFEQPVVASQVSGIKYISANKAEGVNRELEARGLTTAKVDEANIIKGLLKSGKAYSTTSILAELDDFMSLAEKSNSQSTRFFAKRLGLLLSGKDITGRRKFFADNIELKGKRSFMYGIEEYLYDLSFSQVSLPHTYDGRIGLNNDHKLRMFTMLATSRYTHMADLKFDSSSHLFDRLVDIGWTAEEVDDIRERLKKSYESAKDRFMSLNVFVPLIRDVMDRVDIKALTPAFSVNRLADAYARGYRMMLNDTHRNVITAYVTSQLLPDQDAISLAGLRAALSPGLKTNIAVACDAVLPSLNVKNSGFMYEAVIDKDTNDVEKVKFALPGLKVLREKRMTSVFGEPVLLQDTLVMDAAHGTLFEKSDGRIVTYAIGKFLDDMLNWLAVDALTTFDVDVLTRRPDSSKLLIPGHITDSTPVNVLNDKRYEETLQVLHAALDDLTTILFWRDVLSTKLVRNPLSSLQDTGASESLRNGFSGVLDIGAIAYNSKRTAYGTVLKCLEDCFELSLSEWSQTISHISAKLALPRHVLSEDRSCSYFRRYDIDHTIASINDESNMSITSYSFDGRFKSWGFGQFDVITALNQAGKLNVMSTVPYYTSRFSGYYPPLSDVSQLKNHALTPFKGFIKDVKIHNHPEVIDLILTGGRDVTFTNFSGDDTYNAILSEITPVILGFSDVNECIDPTRGLPFEIIIEDTHPRHSNTNIVLDSQATSISALSYINPAPFFAISKDEVDTSLFSVKFKLPMNIDSLKPSWLVNSRGAYEKTDVSLSGEEKVEVENMNGLDLKPIQNDKKGVITDVPKDQAKDKKVGDTSKKVDDVKKPQSQIVENILNKYQ